MTAYEVVCKYVDQHYEAMNREIYVYGNSNLAGRNAVEYIKWFRVKMQIILEKREY